MTRSSLSGDHPWPDLPGRGMPHVLSVPALKHRYPVHLFVLMKANDAPLGAHSHTPSDI